MAARCTVAAERCQGEGCAWHADGQTVTEKQCPHELFRGKTLWDGMVEVFDLIGHPTAKRAYGWTHPNGPGDGEERFVTVLEIAPVASPVTAVRASIVSDYRRSQS